MTYLLSGAGTFEVTFRAETAAWLQQLVLLKKSEKSTSVVEYCTDSHTAAQIYQVLSSQPGLVVAAGGAASSSPVVWAAPSRLSMRDK